jgi:hypothetical protein
MVRAVSPMVAPTRRRANALVRSVMAALPLIGFLAVPARAGTLTVSAASDGNVLDDTGTGNFTSVVTASNGLDIRNFAGQTPNFEHRAIEYFASFTLPTNVTITGVTLNYGVASVLEDPGQVVNVLGYAGGSLITTSDATASATLLNSYHPWPQGLGSQTLDLGSAGISLIKSLSGSSSPLALRFQGVAFGVNTQLYSIENPGGIPLTPP